MADNTNDKKGTEKVVITLNIEDVKSLKKLGKLLKLFLISI